MPETTFACPDLTTFLGLDALGLTAVGQHLTAKRAVIECRMPIGFEDPFCKACGAQGVSRGTVARHLAHEPVGWRPTQLVVRLRRFACTHCRRVWRQDTSGLAEPRARLTHAAVEWGLRALALECMSVSRVAAALGISWHTANNAILTRAEQTITGNPDRFDGVEVLGVDDSPARFALVREVPPLCGTTPGGATGTPAVIIDLTPLARPQWSGPPAGHGPRPVQEGPQDLARRSERVLARAGRGGSHGAVSPGPESATGEELPQARAAGGPLRASWSWLPASSTSAAPPRPTSDHGPAGPGG